MSEPFNLVPGKLNINAVAGDDFSVLLDFNVDLTGYTFDSKILLDNQVANRYQAMTITNTNLSLGRITLSLTDTQTAAIGPIANRKWFISWSQGGDIRTVLSGTFTLNSPWAVTEYSPTTTDQTIIIETPTISVEVIGGAGGAILWGDIQGDIEDQTDLIEYLEENYQANLGTVAQRGLQNQVYIAYRTDGVAGVGTKEDPFDGSTQAKFDALMLGFDPDIQINIGPGTFETRGSDLWYAQDGWQVLGSGIDITTIKLVGQTDTYSYVSFLSTPIGPSTALKQFQAGNFTIDCNAAGAVDPNNINAINVNCIKGLLSNIRAINSGNSGGTGSEVFTLCLSNYDSDDVDSFLTIKDCIVEQFHTIGNGATIIGLLGTYARGSILNNCVKCDPDDPDSYKASAFSAAGSQILVQGNISYNCVGYHFDTSPIASSNTKILDNSFYRVPTVGARLGFTEGTWNYGIIANNFFELADNAIGILFNGNVTGFNISGNIFKYSSGETSGALAVSFANSGNQNISFYLNRVQSAIGVNIPTDGRQGFFNFNESGQAVTYFPFNIPVSSSTNFQFSNVSDLARLAILNNGFTWYLDHRGSNTSNAFWITNEGGLGLMIASSGNISAANLSGTNTGDQTLSSLGAAPSNATYIVQTASSGLSAEQALGTLATGILKNTTTTGVLSSLSSSAVGAVLRRNLANTDYEFALFTNIGAGTNLAITPSTSSTNSDLTLQSKGTGLASLLSGNGSNSVLVDNSIILINGVTSVNGNISATNLSGTNTGDQYGGTTASAANQYLRRNAANGAYEFGDKTEYITSTPTTGQAVSFNDNPTDQLLRINPAGTLADLTVDLPSNATSINGQKVIFMVTQAITNVVVTGASTIFNAPVSMNAGDCFQFYKSASNEWARVIT